MEFGIDNPLTEQPLISIITVVYNDKHGISKTIDSVLGQSYKNIEYIVIDGASTDGTKEIIMNYHSSLAHFISEPDNGIYAAMNKGISLASGAFIGIINSGDHYEPGALELLSKAIIDNKEIDIFHGILRVFQASGDLFHLIGSHSSCLHLTMIEHPTCFVSKNSYLELGKYDEKYASSADYDFMLRMRLNKVQFMFLETIIANFYLGGMSSTNKAILETLKIKERYKLNSKLHTVLMKTYLKFRNILKQH